MLPEHVGVLLTWKDYDNVQLCSSLLKQYIDYACSTIKCVWFMTFMDAGKSLKMNWKTSILKYFLLHVVSLRERLVNLCIHSSYVEVWMKGLLFIHDISNSECNDFTRLCTVLKGWQNKDTPVTVVGVTPVNIAREHCRTQPQSRYLCVRYTLTVPSTDVDTSNNYQCADISSQLDCSASECHITRLICAFMTLDEAK